MWNFLRRHVNWINGLAEMAEMWRRHGLRDYVLTLSQVFTIQDLVWAAGQAGVSYATGWTITGSVLRGLNTPAPKVGVEWAYADLLAEELIRGGPAMVVRFEEALDVRFQETQGSLGR